MVLYHPYWLAGRVGCQACSRQREPGCAGSLDRNYAGLRQVTLAVSTNRRVVEASLGTIGTTGKAGTLAEETKGSRASTRSALGANFCGLLTTGVIVIAIWAGCRIALGECGAGQNKRAQT